MFLLSIIIPLIGLLVFYLICKWDLRTCGIYAGSAIGISLLLAFFCYLGGTRQNYFNEIWNYRAMAVRYYESWDETVPCRHPKYRMVTHTDSDGNVTTEMVFDGYEHFYDVDWHPEHWTAATEYNTEVGISNGEYEAWKKLWNNVHFVDMKRHYHSKDGDMYQSDWTKEFDTIFPLEHTQTYENKVRVSNSVFNYPPVSKEIAKKYFRPADKSIGAAVMSYDGTAYSEYDNLTLRRLNANLGVAHRVHTITLLWDGNRNSRSVMEDVLAAWKGPNKNELVIAIGLGKNREVIWCDVYSWCDDTTIHSLVRQYIVELGTFNSRKICDILAKRIPEKWVKKDFRIFNYIKNPMPGWCYVLSLILSMITSTATGVVIIRNGGDYGSWDNYRS